jgi:hypothetical protein
VVKTKTYNVLVDTQEPAQKTSSFTVNTNDLNTVKVALLINQDGDPLDLTDATVRLAVKKPDQMTVLQDATIIDAANGSCEIVLDTQAYVIPGNYTAEVMVFFGVDTVAVTSTFTYKANRGIMNDEAVESTNEWQSITQAIAQVVTVTGVSVESLGRLVGESDDSGRTQRAVDSLTDGGVLIFPYGKTYYINNVTCTGKSITVIGTGAKVIQNGNATVFTFTGGWDFTVSVSAVANVDYDFSQGNSTTTNVSKVNLSSAPPSTLKIGDTVKVISDDEIDNAYQGGGTETTKKRKGEFATVYFISGNDVYLSGRLRETYSTNIRLSKLKDITFKMDGLTFDVDPSGDALGWNRVLVKFVSAKSVQVDISCLNSYDSFVLMLGVYDYRAKIEAKNCRNEPSNNRYGYGLNDSSCGNGVIYNSTFTNCRHGFTTSTGYIVAGSTSVESYGKSDTITIIDSFGIGCSNSPFDVHEEAYSVTFDNCHAKGTVAGASGSGYGFQARAKKIKFANCSAKNTRGGFYVFEQYAGTTDGVQIVECTTDNVEMSLNIKGSTGAGIKVRNVRISGGKFDSYGAVGNYIENADVSLVNNPEFNVQGYQGFLLFDNANVKVKRAKITSTSTNSAYRIVDITGINVQLDIQELDVDVSNAVATDGKLFRLSNANAILTGDKVNVVTNGKTITNVFDSLGVGTGTLKVIRITADQDATILSDVNFGTLSYSFVSPTKATGVRFQDLSADGTVLATKGIADDNIYIRVKPITADRILGAIPLGVKLGQRLTIRNSASTFNVTVKHGGTYNTAIGADKILPVDGAITLTWSGSQWVNTI